MFIVMRIAFRRTSESKFVLSYGFLLGGAGPFNREIFVDRGGYSADEGDSPTENILREKFGPSVVDCLLSSFTWDPSIGNPILEM